jgi:hypothetical protein
VQPRAHNETTTCSMKVLRKAIHRTNSRRYSRFGSHLFRSSESLIFPSANLTFGRNRGQRPNRRWGRLPSDYPCVQSRGFPWGHRGRERPNLRHHLAPWAWDAQPDPARVNLLRRRNEHDGGANPIPGRAGSESERSRGGYAWTSRRAA